MKNVWEKNKIPRFCLHDLIFDLQTGNQCLRRKSEYQLIITEQMNLTKSHKIALNN